MARITAAFRVEEVVGEARDGRACVRTLEPLEYRVGSAESAEVIVVPAGFKTDFASIPFGFRNLFPPLGPWARAAIIHDFLYDTGGQLTFGAGRGPDRWAQRLLGSFHTGVYFGLIRARPEVNARDYNRAEADAIFKEAMAVVGVPAWRREVMFRAVRLGGGSGWRDEP